jgi:hypothetical protein
MTAGRAAVVATAVAALAGACSQPTGVRVDLTLGDFGAGARSLEVVLIAVPGGFRPTGGETIGNVTITAEDRDGDQVPDLVLTFASDTGFPRAMSFRVTTGNQHDLTVHATARAFDATSVIADGASASADLPAGGEATLALALAAPVGPMPGTVVDLAVAGSADVTVAGAQKSAALSAVAACDVDGDGTADLVVGLPGAAPNDAVGATGAVYVVFGGGPNAVVDLASPSAGTSTAQIFGLSAGDQLGAAVACADLDGDHADDIIIGAPGVQGATAADIGVGSVYVVHGRLGLRSAILDLTQAPAKGGPDVVLVGAAAGTQLGASLLAADLDGDGHAELLVSESGQSGDGHVHLLTGLGAAGWTGRQVLDASAPPHVTFTGLLSAAAMSAGDLDDNGKFLDVILGDQAFGAVYVFPSVDPKGTQALAPGDAKLRLMGPPAGAEPQFGAAVLALDTQGLGPDLIVGSPAAGLGAGAVYVYTHDAHIFDTLMRAPARTLTGAGANDRFGGTLAGIALAGGSRMFVGATEVAHDSKPSVGSVYVYRGTPAGPTLVEQIFGADANGRLGSALAAGQIGGSGLGDVFMAAPGAMGHEVGAGVAYVRFGR